jgi:penicillin amidase
LAAAPQRSLRQVMALRAALAGAGVGALIGGTALGAWYRLMRRPLPAHRGTLRLPGLDHQIEILRDRWGVPHVHARTRQDLWFGQGFCHAQDRLWQLELYRRMAAGRISEIAGRAGLPADRLVRTLGFRHVSEQEVKDMDEALAASLEAYCAGVNAGARQRPLPAEFQILRVGFDPWQPVDTVSAQRLLSFGLSTNWERELLRAEMVRELGAELTDRLEPPYPAGNPIITAPGEPWSGDGLALAGQIDEVRETLGFASQAGGSNNWAVAGSRTKSGRPLLAGDPHLPSSMPGVVYEVGLYEGDRFIRGGSIPGSPGVFFGQNNDVAWTFTNVLADVQDLFIERIGGETYEFEGERRPVETREEQIKVKGRDPERLRVLSTHHGPIVNAVLGADAAEPLALAFAALKTDAFDDAHVGVLDVRSGPELVELLESSCTPVSNCVWADGAGSIGYKMVGRIPMRRSKVADLPKPGWTGEHEWDGWVPYADLPESVDPECGYIVTANNRVADDDYAHHISSDYLDGYRARRVEELLLEHDEHDRASFEAIQTDLHSIPGLECVRRLARLEDDVTNQRELSAIERLRSWDGRMSADSIAASIYQAFALRLAQETARAIIGDRDLIERWLDRSPSGFLTHVTSPWRWLSHLLALWEEADDELIGRSWDEHVLDALRGGLDDLEERFGLDAEAWRWGAVHQLSFPHAVGQGNPVLAHFFNRTLEVGGAEETVCQVAYDPNEPYKAIWAPCWRMVADPAEPDSARWQQFTGQSGHPGSPHYDDLQALWLAGQSKPIAGEGPWKQLTLVPA